MKMFTLTLYLKLEHNFNFPGSDSGSANLLPKLYYLTNFLKFLCLNSDFFFS